MPFTNWSVLPLAASLYSSTVYMARTGGNVSDTTTLLSLPIVLYVLVMSLGSVSAGKWMWWSSSSTSSPPAEERSGFSRVSSDGRVVIINHVALEAWPYRANRKFWALGRYYLAGVGVGDLYNRSQSAFGGRVLDSLGTVCIISMYVCLFFFFF